MNEYAIKYHEIYCKEYIVEAENEEEAKEQLADMLYDGKLDPPHECKDSYFEITHTKKLVHVLIGNNMCKEKFDVPIDTSIIELFVMAGITPYKSAGGLMLTLNGEFIQKEDTFKSLSEFDIEDEVYLLATPICHNV